MKSLGNIALIVYFLRKKRALTQEELSALSGVQQAAISNIEKGKKVGFSERQLNSILVTLGKIDKAITNDEDLFLYVSKKIQSETVFAVCSILDAYFSSLSSDRNIEFLKKFKEIGMDISIPSPLLFHRDSPKILYNGQPVPSYNYIPSRIVFEGLSLVYGENLNDFFGISPFELRFRSSAGLKGKYNIKNLKKIIDKIIYSSSESNPFLKFCRKLSLDYTDYFEQFYLFSEQAKREIDLLKIMPLTKIEKFCKNPSNFFEQVFLKINKRIKPVI